MTKSELRKEFLERRRGVSAGEVAEASRRIAERFFANVELDGVRFLHTFIRIPKFNEIDTSAIYMRVWRDLPEITTVAPRVDHGTGGMDGIAFDEQTPLAEGRWGIREPAAGALIAPEKLDVVLVPMLIFDRAGHRVGYGKGFYDRFLKQVRPDCVKAGLCLWGPLDEPIETSEMDVALDLFITPNEIYRPGHTIDASGGPPN
ncbi:MAG: putative 5-formyltetrahydrofolate cyclo-ligase [Acidobacteria bacterium OLB17]|nr:MAG: putative 5-formyltetrahydrofolate cyclo-ligase [Acidobacteria bacterium OLB17]MCZ2390680.1 5-formyltetrahydrofolate cyclo-ligase [Acidobacteriota bacterium]